MTRTPPEGVRAIIEPMLAGEELGEGRPAVRMATAYPSTSSALTTSTRTASNRVAFVTA
jgi:hypothetical protein